MRGSTRYWIGVRHVGDADWPQQIQQLPVAEMFKFLFGLMGPMTLAQRLDICIGRTEAEVLDRLYDRRKGGAGQKLTGNESLSKELDAMWAEAGLMDEEAE